MKHEELIKRLRSIAKLEAANAGLEPSDAAEWEAADALESKDAEIERLKAALATANSNQEEFERKWYLVGDERDALQAKLDALQKQEPVAYIQTQKGGEVELVWDKDEELEGELYEYTPLCAAPVVAERKPLTRKQIDDLAEEGIFLGNVYEITAEIESAHGIGGQP